MSAAIHAAAHLPMTQEQSRLAAAELIRARNAIAQAFFNLEGPQFAVLRSDMAGLQSQLARMMLDHGNDSLGDSPIARLILREYRDAEGKR